MGDLSGLTWGHTAFTRRRFARIPYHHEGGGYT
jgi:hypothetical protein